jgi:hypothetical protein
MPMVIDSDSDLDAEGEDDVDALMELSRERGDTPVRGQGVMFDPSLFSGKMGQQYPHEASFLPVNAGPSNGGGRIGRVYSVSAASQSLLPASTLTLQPFDFVFGISQDTSSKAFTSSQSNDQFNYASPYNPASTSYNNYPHQNGVPSYQPPTEHDDYYANLRGASPSPPLPTPARPQRNRQRTSSSIDSGSRVGPLSVPRTVEGRKKRAGESRKDLATPGSYNGKRRVKGVGGGGGGAHKRDVECSFCMGTDSMNREGIPEEMLSCDLCGRSGEWWIFAPTSELKRREIEVGWLLLYIFNRSSDMPINDIPAVTRKGSDLRLAMYRMQGL